MKNNILYPKNLLIFLLLLLITLFSFAESKEIKFESETIEILDKDRILALGKVEVFDDNYNLRSDKFDINKKTKIHILSGNVFLEDKYNNKILANKILIDENNQKYTTLGKTTLFVDNSYNIETKNLIYFKSIKKIISNDSTIIKDEFNNDIFLDGFTFNINSQILKAQNTKIVDEKKNTYEIKKLFYDFDQKKIYGKDIAINRENKNLINKNQLARSKSRSITIENNNTTLRKTAYTNCKKRDGCPPWLLLADRITHDKLEKSIKYDNAILKFYDVPVLYFPKFFHPDPFVKRQTGFLTPLINTNKSKNYINMPYFLAISKQSDFTFSPRIYDNSEILYQGEFRKETQDSSNVVDASIFKSDLLPNSDNSTKSHFFLKSKLLTNFNFFEESYIDIDLQMTSNENYLKAFDIQSPIINSQNLLNSNFSFNANNEDWDLFLSTEVYEDLTKKNSSDKYEYILPNFSLTKNLNTELDGNLEFSTSGYSRTYDTNVSEKKVINNLNYISNNFYDNLGLVNNYEILIKNVNSDAKNSDVTSNDIKNDLNGIFQYNLKLPMQKKGKENTKVFIPRIALKYNPSKNKNINQANRIIDFNNIFSINRISSSEILEGGQSLTLGGEYKIYNKDNFNDQVFGLNLATSLREKENNDLPAKSSLNKKTSNFVGNANLKINNFVTLDYDFITKNDLSEFNYHNIKSSFKVNNFVTKFEFIEENNEIGNESYLANESSLSINQNSSLLFRTRENKKTNLREYYDLIYQYEMDCLVAGIKYGKKYYTDGALQPEESIMFSITLLPFNNKINLPKLD